MLQGAPGSSRETQGGPGGPRGGSGSLVLLSRLTCLQRFVSAGFSQGLTDELEVFLDHITTEYGSLTAFGASCPGNLYLAGHSMGGGIAAVLGYMANLKSDPLALGKPVAGLYLFAAMPPATSQLTNEQSADGCFAGSNYYTRSLEGVVPGYPALADATFLDGSMAVAGYPDYGMVPAKTGFTSFDLAGPAPNVSNLLGPGVLTPCGDLPEIMTTMRNTTNWAKFNSYFMNALNPDPACIGYHEPFAYLEVADAVAMGA